MFGFFKSKRGIGEFEVLGHYGSNVERQEREENSVIKYFLTPLLPMTDDDDNNITDVKVR